MFLNVKVQSANACLVPTDYVKANYHIVYLHVRTVFTGLETKMKMR